MNPGTREEQRWTIEKWGANYQAGAIKGPETEQIVVVPESSPNVLTPEEAGLLVKARDGVLGDADFDAIGELCNRLQAWTEEEGH
jgi:hypothetical protein